MKILVAALALLCAVLIFAVFVTRRAASPAITTATTLHEPRAVKRAPVIVELFTSEGCSSCPPADVVLAQLDKTQPIAEAEVIALSEHVDYWNYIGWADPFSSAAFSARQEAYATAFGRDGIYTPQMVVDGQSEFVGSNADKARAAIARAARASKAEVTITRAAKETEPRALRLAVSVANVPALSANDVAEVLLAITENNLSSNVARGENSGRKLAHSHVVRELRALGKVEATKSFAGATTVLMAEQWKRAELRAVVFVQERAHRRVLGAAAISLANN